MGIPLHLYIPAISLFHLLCTQRVNCDNSEIICSAWKQVRCTPSKNIRVHDVIYGHVVGRDECNTQPTTNCTAPNGFCEVAEKVEGRSVSEWLRSSDTISPPPCGGKDIYIFVNYSCVEILRLSGENFAVKKAAQQSTTTYEGIASRAVDGKKSRIYNDRSCTHTAEQTTPWWRVDLQQRITVTQVKIANREILGDRLSGFEIRIGDSLENNGITNLRCGTQQHIPSNRWGTVWCDPTLIGRYVTIVIPGEKKMLTLCEVEVYGIKEGENFAFKKPAQQSKTTHGGVASRAVDGNKNRYYTSGSCTHTAEQTTPWWRVDLQQRIAVTHVKIVNRNRIGKRLCGFEIRIGDSLENNGITSPRCGTQQHIPSNQEGIVSCVPTVVGRYVTIVIPGVKKLLTLCEVEVYGIKEDQFITPSDGQIIQLFSTTKSTTLPSSTTENSKPVNTAAKKEDGVSTVVVWHIVVTLVSEFILGILFSYIVSCSRRRWLRNRNPEPKTTEVDTTYQELDLSKMNTEDNYQSLRVNATNNDTAVNDDESNYTELNKTTDVENNYESLT